MKNVYIFWDRDKKEVTISFDPSLFNYSWHGDFEHYFYRLKNAVQVLNEKLSVKAINIESIDKNIVLKLSPEDIIAVDDNEEYADIIFIENDWQYILAISYINGSLNFAVKFMESYGLFN